LVILASGSGTTLQALLDADLPAEVVAAGTDVAGCAAMARATAAGVATFTVVPADYPDRAAWNLGLADTLGSYQPDLVVLAGFMRILAPSVVRRFRIVNTHPSLLPAFPGAHALRDAIASGATETGVTVHWVDEGVDTGPVIAQASVRIEAGDDEDALRARVQAVEKPLFIDSITQLCKELF
jgi:formyltetrahydrofolate-dependent phosphoribosylglycinamide formyltransferase